MPKPKRKTDRAILTEESVVYLGVDPGWSGGFAFIVPGNGILLIKMPSTWKAIWLTLEAAKKDYPTNLFACIEWIHPAIYGVGKSAMSKLYGNYTALHMALNGLAIPYEEVKPKQWQSGIKIPSRKNNETTTQWKNRLKDKATTLFSISPTLATSDALLIAEYARRNRLGGFLQK